MCFCQITLSLSSYHSRPLNQFGMGAFPFVESFLNGRSVNDIAFIHYPKWYAQILHLPLVTRKKCVLFSLDTHTIGSPQNSFRLHALQCFPIQTSSNWFMACSTNSGLSVRMPASKFRVPSPFMPMPAPVRLALPI